MVTMLHHEVKGLADLVGGVVLSTEPMSGSMCFENNGNRELSLSTPEDAAVRFGQLLCRWAAEQESDIRVRVGVHTGDLFQIGLPTSPIPGFFGSALATARTLAANSPLDTCVHFEESTRDNLTTLEGLPFSVYCTPQVSFVRLQIGHGMASQQWGPWKEHGAKVGDGTNEATSNWWEIEPETRTTSAKGWEREWEWGPERHCQCEGEWDCMSIGVLCEFEFEVREGKWKAEEEETEEGSSQESAHHAICLR